MNLEAGKWLMLLGAILLIAGVIYTFFGYKLGWIGNLPGDIRIEREHSKIYFPITTMILFSVLINLIIKLVQYLK